MLDHIDDDELLSELDGKGDDDDDGAGGTDAFLLFVRQALRIQVRAANKNVTVVNKM